MRSFTRPSSVFSRNLQTVILNATASRRRDGTRTMISMKWLNIQDSDGPTAADFRNIASWPPISEDGSSSSPPSSSSSLSSSPSSSSVYPRDTFLYRWLCHFASGAIDFTICDFFAATPSIVQTVVESSNKSLAMIPLNWTKLMPPPVFSTPHRAVLRSVSPADFCRPVMSDSLSVRGGSGVYKERKCPEDVYPAIFSITVVIGCLYAVALWLQQHSVAHFLVVEFLHLMLLLLVLISCRI